MSPSAISIAIGGGALALAIEEMRWYQGFTHDTATSDDYCWEGRGRISDTWVRPNTGPGNPHTRLIDSD